MTATISGVLNELYSAPLEAAVNAEAEYRRIWLKWINGKKALLGDDLSGVDMRELFATAPVVSVNSRVDLAITMRIASVKEINAEGTIGLQLGPIHSSGSLGFINRTTTESTLQASTSVVMSNNEENLLNYLAQHNINPTDPASLTAAVALLSAE